MKKTLTCIAALGTVMPSALCAADAVRCIPYTSSMKCDTAINPESIPSVVTATCTVNGNTNVKYEILGAISDDEGGSTDIRNSLNISRTTWDATGYCWCKLISPVVSKRVTYSAPLSDDTMTSCATLCATYMKTNTYTRRLLFSSQAY